MKDPIVLIALAAAAWFFFMRDHGGGVQIEILDSNGNVLYKAPPQGYASIPGAVAGFVPFPTRASGAPLPSLVSKAGPFAGVVLGKPSGVVNT